MSQIPPERTMRVDQSIPFVREIYSKFNKDKAEIFCSYCASKLNQDDKTCSRCGAPTKDSYYENSDNSCIFTEHLQTDKFGFSQLSRIPIGDVNIIYQKVEDGAQIVKSDYKKIQCRPNRMIKAIYRCNTL